MTKNEIDLLTSELSKSNYYLEYGAGGSTKLAVQQDNIQTIVSVESDWDYAKEQFHEDMDIKNALSSNRLTILFPDIGPTKEWGYPKDDNHKYLWPNYSLCPYQRNFKTPDLILIDGRFRVACGLLAALNWGAATVLVHDYMREKYHILEQFYSRVQQVDSLAVLIRKPDINEKKVQKLIRRYLFIPNDTAQTLSFRAWISMNKFKKHFM